MALVNLYRYFSFKIAPHDYPLCEWIFIFAYCQQQNNQQNRQLVQNSRFFENERIQYK